MCWALYLFHLPKVWYLGIFSNVLTFFYNEDRSKVANIECDSRHHNLDSETLVIFAKEILSLWRNTVHRQIHGPGTARKKKKSVAN